MPDRQDYLDALKTETNDRILGMDPGPAPPPVTPTPISSPPAVWQPPIASAPSAPSAPPPAPPVPAGLFDAANQTVAAQDAQNYAAAAKTSGIDPVLLSLMTPAQRMAAVTWTNPVPARVDPAKLEFAPAPKAAAAPSHGFAMPAARVVPAHSVDVVNPIYQAQQQKAAEREKSLTLQQGEQGVKGGLANGQGLAGVVSAEQAQAAAMQRAEAERQARVQPMVDHEVQVARERARLGMQLSHEEADKRSGWKRVGDSVAAGLSALGGLGGGNAAATNPVLTRIHDDIQREVDRQKTEYARKGDEVTDADNLWAKVYRMTGDHAQADEAVRQVGVQAAKDHVDALVATTNAPGLRTAAQIAKTHLDQADLQRQIQERPWMQARGGGPTQAQIVARAQAIANDSAKTGQVLDPKDAYRRAVLEFTGKDVSSGDLAGYGKGPSGSFSPTTIPSLAGAATDYDWRKLIAGTGLSPEIDAKLEKQDVYNAEVEGFVKQNMGLRGPAADRAKKAYAVSSGMTPAGIKNHYKAYSEAIARHPNKAGGGTGGGREGDADVGGDE